ncbi:MAG TPA: hypothetical protein VF212_00330 [Longimicrobiales bacterium]
MRSRRFAIGRTRCGAFSFTRNPSRASTARSCSGTSFRSDGGNRVGSRAPGARERRAAPPDAWTGRRTATADPRASGARARRRCGGPACIALAALLAAGPSVAAAQNVVAVGRGDAELDERLDRLIIEDDYLLVTRDTLIAAGDSVPRTLLVADATLTLEGAVAGDLVGVDANLFVRPSARVHGDVVNVGGGLYPSGLARIGGAVVDEPLAPYRVERDGGDVRIIGTADMPVLDLGGAFGFEPPTYDRVDALALRWGAGLLLPPLGAVEPRLNGWIGYASGRGALNGGLELEARLGRTRLAFGGEEQTETQVRWIRGDLRNSLSFLVNGKDRRNYYEAEIAYAELAREFGRDGLGGTARLRAQYEDDESLGAGDPWTIFEEDIRLNPPIDDGQIASLVVGLEGEWIGRNAAAEAGVDLEFADEVLGADFGFDRFVLRGEWAMDALANHLLEVEWRFQGPLLGTESLPRQRWSFIGGSGTLTTFETAQFRGDRLVFVETEYVIPLPQRLGLPILGAPDLQLIHVAGMAWTDDAERDIEQNVGVRLQFFGPFIRVMTNPADALDDVELDVGLSWPFDGERPWRRPQ